MRYKVEYGGVTYEQEGLDFADLIKFGTIIQPRLLGLGASVGAIVSDKAVVNSEVESFYKTVERVFSPDEWAYLIGLFLINERNLLIINGEALDTDQVKEHFKGDFLRAYTVATKLALKNLGESAPFMESLGGFMKNMAEFFAKFLKEKLETIESGLQKAVNGRQKR